MDEDLRRGTRRQPARRRSCPSGGGSVGRATGAGRRRAAVALAALVAAGVSCRDDDSASSPDALPTSTTVAGAPLAGVADAPLDLPATLPLPPGYELGDLRGVALTPVTGRRQPAPPATAVAMAGGRSHLAGTVLGPEGPVDGATVRIERFVDGASGSVDVTSAPDGSFRVGGLHGGRYRVRAWRQPTLATVHPTLTFLAADEGQDGVQVVVERRTATTMAGTIGVAAWRPGGRAGVSVLVSQEVVDGQGIVRAVGVRGALITLRVPTGVSLLSEASVETGADGYARFGVVCTGAGTR